MGYVMIINKPIMQQSTRLSKYTLSTLFIKRQTGNNRIRDKNLERIVLRLIRILSC